MNIDGYGEFPFEIGDIARDKEDGTVVRIRSAHHEYIWYHIIFVGNDLDARPGDILCTRTERFEDEWEFVSKLGVTFAESANEINRQLRQIAVLFYGSLPWPLRKIFLWLRVKGKTP